MDQARKETIINEILFWKEHKMLPDHYCDFLLALYQEESVQTPPKKTGKLNKLTVYLLLVGLILCLSVFVIYFTELGFILQTVILTFFVVLFLFLGIYYSKKEYWYFIFLLGSALLLLLASIYLNGKWFDYEPKKLIFTLILNCLLWLACGLKFKLPYFIYAGILGIIVVIVSIALY